MILDKDDLDGPGSLMSALLIYLERTPCISRSKAARSCIAAGFTIADYAEAIRGLENRQLILLDSHDIQPTAEGIRIGQKMRQILDSK